MLRRSRWALAFTLVASLGATARAVPTWSHLGPVLDGRQFDAVRGPSGSVHVIASEYAELTAAGAVVLTEPQGDGRQGGLDFPPAIAVGPDGAVHIVTRHGGSFADGHDIRYRRRSASGSWDVDVLLGSPVARNYVVAVTAVSSLSLALSSQAGANVWGDLHLWSASATPSQLGSLADLWRADADARLRAHGERIALVAGKPDPDGSASIAFADGGGNVVGDFGASVVTHQAGSGRRGFPDVWFDQNGHAHFVYGAEQQLYYNRYDAQGAAVFASDVRVFDGLGTWHLSTGLGAVAASDDGATVLAVALVTNGSQEASDSQLVWSASTDGGATWSAQATVGKQTHGGEGRARPRLVGLGSAFMLLFNSTSGQKLEVSLASGFETPGADAGGAGGAPGGGGSGGAVSSGGSPASGGAPQTPGGGVVEGDDGCGCGVVGAPVRLGGVWLLTLAFLLFRRLKKL
ncbi:MAG: hypothetical protein AMXMBFR56_47090 [Polyangiaceae bacterium]